jgi:hypothetical protein
MKTSAGKVETAASDCCFAANIVRLIFYPGIPISKERAIKASLQIQAIHSKSNFQKNRKNPAFSFYF